MMLTVTFDGKPVFSHEVESVESVTTIAGTYELKATFAGPEENP